MITFDKMQDATEAQRAALVDMLARSENAETFREAVIEEIARRLRTMKPANFIHAACDILSQSKL